MTKKQKPFQVAEEVTRKAEALVRAFFKKANTLKALTRSLSIKAWTKLRIQWRAEERMFKGMVTKIMPEVEKVRKEVAKNLNSADRVAQEVAESARSSSDNFLMEVEGAVERLPIDRISKSGVITTKEGKTFVAIDLSDLPLEILRRILDQLHGLGPGEPFKLTFEVSISGSTIDRHIAYLNEQVAKNQHKWEKISPKATLPFETLYRWYLDLCEKIRSGHKVVKPLLIVSEVGIRMMVERLRGDPDMQTVLVSRVQTVKQTSVTLLGLFHNFHHHNPQPYREYRYKKDTGESEIESLSPDKFVWGQDRLRAVTRRLWSEDEGKSPGVEQTFYRTFTVYNPEGTKPLEELLLPFINHEGRRAYFAQVVRSVSKGAYEKRAMKVARKRMYSFSGIHSIPKAELNEQLDLFGYPDNPKAESLAYKLCLGETKWRYWQAVLESQGAIKTHNRKAFLASATTLVVKSDSAEDLEVFADGLEEAFRDSHIWYEAEDDWSQNELKLHSILPSLVEWETQDSCVTIPRWDLALARDAHYESVYIPEDSQMFGRLKKDGMPLGTKLAILAAQGTHASGKSFTGKIIAMFARLFDPGRRVIVVDNTSAADLAAVTKEHFVDESRQKGWVDMANAMGGDVLFAIQYDTPEAWRKKLEEVEQSGSRFIVIYPDRSREARAKDIEMLYWLLGALRRFHKPEEFGEDEIQQVLVIDDALAWNADVEGSDGLPSRMKLLTADVFNQCISSGALLYLTAQAAASMEAADKASHAVTTAGIIAWLNFVTSASGAVPKAIGMERYTPEGERLMQKTAAGLEKIAGPTMGVPENPGDCVVTFRNVREEDAEILIPSDEVRTPEGKTFKGLLSRKKA